MALPPDLIATIQPHTGPVLAARPVGGGCIAHASRLETERGVFFLKWAAGAAGAGFVAEAAGLRALSVAAPEEIVVPRPIEVAIATPDAPGYLLTEWIEPAPDAPGRSARFGSALASLHRAAPAAPHPEAPFGFAIDTYCGPTPQANEWMSDWPTFFGERRLLPIAARLREAGRWAPAWEAPFGRLLAGLGERLPARPAPALLHGDLWSGNTFPAAGGATALVDPAAYVGDREADLAMTELFGGFDASFHDAYREEWPLKSGYAGRREIYSLYHQMNHALLFGGGYVGAVGRALLAVT
jgi:fructosamine-3-kinase